MPKNYNRPNSPNRDYRAEQPNAHSPGGGEYSNPRGSQRAATGGSYSTSRGSQGAAGGGSYSWSKSGGGSSPGGGDYNWSKNDGGSDPTGDVNAAGGLTDRAFGRTQSMPGPSKSTKPDIYNPVQNGTI